MVSVQGLPRASSRSMVILQALSADAGGLPYGCPGFVTGDGVSFAPAALDPPTEETTPVPGTGRTRSLARGTTPKEGGLGPVVGVTELKTPSWHADRTGGGKKDRWPE